jgi:glycerol-3-phosphate dehydrogenase (NAD(P)+)
MMSPLKTMNRPVILGDGQMALVLADALATKLPGIVMWGPVEKPAHDLAKSRISPRLPELRLSDSVEVMTDDQTALAGATLIISAIPTQFLAAVWKRLAPRVESGAVVVSVTKGIEIDTLRRPTEVIEQALAAAGRPAGSLCALSGPSIAAELARRMPASLVAASNDSTTAATVQDLLGVPWLRIYRHDDVVGVELAGATKNVIALAAGMIDGLKAGDNAKSALLARGLAEIARLGVAMGGKVETFFGVAGVGDLATTCFSPEGRNRTCGERLASGQSLDSVLASMSSVVEGVPTTRAVMQLAKSMKVDMPITAAVHAILFEGLKPQEAIRGLMGREQKAERVG